MTVKKGRKPVLFVVMEYQELKNELCKYSEIYLYGAGVVAYGACKAIEHMFGKRIKGFLITDKKKQQQIEEIQVYSLEEAQINKEASLILIATPEEYHEEIEQILQKNKYEHYIKLDSHTEYVLMSRYLKEEQNLNLIEDYPVIETLKAQENIGIYMAISHKDKKLKRRYMDMPWIKKMQVGAVLTEQRMAKLTDEGEDTISCENALYGELTATYCAWRNSNYKITGLFHYRRVLNITEEQLHLLETGELDVILPLPFVCFPDASGQYGRYLLPEDIEIMRQVLKERVPEEFKEIMQILRVPYLYNYNILIARKEVFHDYCSWIFPLLKEIAYRCEREERERLPRYIGRIGEVLTSIYFMRNEKGWKIAHAEKVWRV